jgi:hypothetical protein
MPAQNWRPNERSVVKTTHELERLLEAQRKQIGATMADRQVGVAACEVLDWLIGRTKALADQSPADAPITRSYLENQAPLEIEALRVAGLKMQRVGELVRESSEVVHQQRQPWVRFVRRVEAEGYRVDPNTFLTVTGGIDGGLFCPCDLFSTDLNLQVQVSVLGD